jgi:hypothetical protein
MHFSKKLNKKIKIQIVTQSNISSCILNFKKPRQGLCGIQSNISSCILNFKKPRQGLCGIHRLFTMKETFQNPGLHLHLQSHRFRKYAGMFTVMLEPMGWTAFKFLSHMLLPTTCTWSGYDINYFSGRQKSQINANYDTCKSRKENILE